MFRRSAVAVMLAIVFGAVTCSAAAKFGKDDEWLIYMYICGAALEEEGHVSTRNISELQQVNLPPNVKVLINANGSRIWHHPALKEGGNGFYLYAANRLQKLEDRNENMGDPQTLKNFLEYGERNFKPAHRILIFRGHGGLNGICYDSTFDNDCLTYDELNETFSAVYSDSPAVPPFELIGFGACLSASYELANSIANFAHYMVGSEPSSYGWYLTDWLAKLAKNPALDGAQLGKIICDSNMESYGKTLQKVQTFSVIDLTKIPVLREATEEFFNAALKRSNESAGFTGAFARAFYARNADNYSNVYTDLGMLAENTKHLLPRESKNLKQAISKAVVYKNCGAYLNATGISTCYPYLSVDVGSISKEYLEYFLTSKAMPDAQKTLYRNLMNLDVSELESFELTFGKDFHAMARLDSDELQNVLTVRCTIFPVVENGNVNLGINDKGVVFLRYDELEVDWKKGTFTENIRPVQTLFDGHRIMMWLSYQGDGYNVYEVPIILKKNNVREAKFRVLNVRYDLAKKEYSIMGLGNVVEKGFVSELYTPLEYGDVITPVFIALIPKESIDRQSNDLFDYSYVEEYEDENDLDPDTNQPKTKERVVDAFLASETAEYTDPNTGGIVIRSVTAGESFVYNKNSKITETKISSGLYLGYFNFIAPNGMAATSLPFTLEVTPDEMERDVLDELDMQDFYDSYREANNPE